MRAAPPRLRMASICYVDERVFCHKKPSLFILTTALNIVRGRALGAGRMGHGGDASQQPLRPPLWPRPDAPERRVSLPALASG